jgi:lysozyme
MAKLDFQEVFVDLGNGQEAIYQAGLNDTPDMIAADLERADKEGFLSSLFPDFPDATLKPSHPIYDADFSSMETAMSNVGDNFRNFMIEEEGSEDKAYKDSIGATTIGVGHKLTKEELKSGFIKINGENVKWGEGLTGEQVNLLFDKDMERFSDKAQAMIKQGGLEHVPNLTAAVSSLLFNIGVNRLKGTRAEKALLRGDLAAFKFEAFDSKAGFVYAKGKPILRNRRAAELALLDPNRGIERTQMGPAGGFGEVGLQGSEGNDDIGYKGSLEKFDVTRRRVGTLQNSSDASLGDEIIGDLPTKESAAEFTAAFKMSDEQLAVLDKEREAVSALIAEGKFMEASAASPETNKMLMFNMLGAGIIKSVGKAGLRLIQGGGKTTPPDPPILKVHKGGAPTAAEEAAALARKEELDEAARIIENALKDADKKKVKDALKVIKGGLNDKSPILPAVIPGAIAGEKAFDDVIKGQQGADVLGATHTVVSGDTLSKIARDNNTTVDAIMEVNRGTATEIKDANKISIGDQINLGSSDTVAAPSVIALATPPRKPISEPLETKDIPVKFTVPVKPTEVPTSDRIMTLARARNFVEVARKTIGIHEDTPDGAKAVKGFLDKAIGTKDAMGSDPDKVATTKAWCTAWLYNILTDAGVGRDKLANQIKSTDPYDFLRAHKYKTIGDHVWTKGENKKNIKAGDIMIKSHTTEEIKDPVNGLEGRRPGYAGHVGIVTKVRGNEIFFIAGNSGGKEVKESSYSLVDKDILIRRPTGVKKVPQEVIDDVLAEDKWGPIIGPIVSLFN